MLRQLSIAAILALATLVSGYDKGVEKPATDPVLGTDTVHGCYSSKGQLDDGRFIEYNSQGECNKICRDQLKKVVAATYSNTCYCGDMYPNNSTLVPDSQCNEPCPGYDKEACGGLGTFTIYNTGLRVGVAEAPAETTSSAAVAAPTTPAPVSSISSTPTPDNPSSSSGPSTVGIAVGVVVGILALAAVAGGVFFYMRRKRNSEIEEEHRRNAAVNAFIGGGKPPGSSDGLSMSDSRLDPVIANRRMSSGSIADNQDYSRRILRVTNA